MLISESAEAPNSNSPVPSSMIATAAVFLLGVALGAALILGGALYLALLLLFEPPGSSKPRTAPPLPRPPPPPSSSSADDPIQEGELGALNAALAWVWGEVGSSAGVRRWAVRKLSAELEELQGGALGRFFSVLSLHSLQLGQTLPKVTALSLGEERGSEIVDLLLDLDYDGELAFTIAAETHTRHAALLSVTVAGVKGRGRLQFSSKPYPHWSFSFVDPPILDLRVESPGGKALSHVTNLIASQLKRIVRKRHTLPAYKVRYKPLFSRVERLLAPPPPPPAADVKGTLTLGLLHAKGLLITTSHSSLYATVSVGEVDWVAVYAEEKEGEGGAVVVIRDVVVLKGSSSSLPVTLAMGAELPFVESLSPPPPNEKGRSTLTSSLPDSLAVGDDLLLVDGRPSVSVKSVVKAFRSSASSKVVWRIRRRIPLGGGGGSSSPLLEVPPASPLTSTSTTPPGSRRSSLATPTSPETPPEPPLPSIPSTVFPVGSSSVFRSTSLPSVREPSWREVFEFQVAEKLSRFINVNIWSGGEGGVSPTASPSKTPKTNGGAIVIAGGDRLVASLNLSLVDVLTECGATGQGAFSRDFFLNSPDPTAPEARDEVLSAQAGFEPHMCYGKVSLSFHFDEDVDRSRRGSRPPPVEEVGAEALEEEEDKAQQLQHSFVRTHFRSATSCHYCNRKIWLKEAFLCGRCGMRVHKKCHERCVANTVCRGSGFYAPLITTSAPDDESDPPTEVIGQEEHPQEVESSSSDPPPPSTPSTAPLTPSPAPSSSRRKTLGGLLASAKNSAAHLRRAGSTSNLSPSTGASSSTLLSRSLPPSPTPARKDLSTANPFEGLRVEEVENTVGILAALPPTDTLVALAKESGRNALSHLGPQERKAALNDVLNRLGEEMEGLPGGEEDRAHALALLMLHFASALQTLQEATTPTTS